MKPHGISNGIRWCEEEKMIPSLQGHITDAQVQAILDIIVRQYRRYLRLTNSGEFNNVFAEEYAPHKKQHSVSWAISSGFPSKSVISDSLVVNCLRYGRGHTRPVLSNENIELMILNKTTHFQADYLRTRYLYNQHNFESQKLFAYIKFEVEHGQLKFVSLCLPDEMGNIIDEDMLLTTANILGLAS